MLQAKVTPFDPIPEGTVWLLLPINNNYEVSEYGHLRRACGGSNSRKGKIIKPTLSGAKRRRIPYVKYTISRNSVEVTIHAHRLVAVTFLGMCPAPNFEVAHEDGNGLNCHYTNLRWSTREGNAEDKRRHGTLVIGERVNTNKLTAQQVREIREASGLQREIGERYGICQTHVSDIKARKIWRHI